MTTALPFFQIDAFATRPFEGNPAAVMPLGAWLPDATLQAIAQENNLSETAFIVRTGRGRWHLRRFTPTTEVPLCGHATLAAGHAVLAEGGFDGDSVGFDTQSGLLEVSRAGPGRYAMSLPVDAPRRTPVPEGLAEALGANPAEVWAGSYLMAVFDTPNEVRALKPDFRALKAIRGEATREAGNIICAAQGAGFGPDVVLRFFAPGSGIDEDPTTGSAFSLLTPVFATRLMRQHLTAYQAFPGRGAEVHARLAGDRVILTGCARTVIRGEFSYG
jgi:PhzF family phenazine biosynthesis protein